MKNVINNGCIVHLDTILERRGISRYKLCKDTGISRKTIRDLEKRDFQISTLIKIADYLKIRIEHLISVPLIDNYENEVQSKMYHNSKSLKDGNWIVNSTIDGKLWKGISSEIIKGQQLVTYYFCPYCNLKFGENGFSGYFPIHGFHRHQCPCCTRSI